MKKREFVTITCLLLFICTASMAQTKVQLTILEAKTEQPIIAANIAFAENDNPEKTLYAITDLNGNAILKLPRPGTYHYHITSVGYIPLKGKITQATRNLTLHMTEDVMGLNEVVITGSRTARPIKLSPVTTQVLGGKALVDAGYGNLQQALQQETPGLNIQKVGFGNEISMQGLDARHVLFLMDGERLTGDMAGNLDYERFNLHAIDRIEIVKGASSTLYGSRAAGAVINLITKKDEQTS